MQRLQQQLQHLAPRPAAGSESGTFVDFEALLTDSGVRLTAIPGIFAVVVEFIRYMLHARGVSYTLGSTDRDDTTRLYEETKQESIPTLFVDDERPLSSWLETTYRVASLGSGPELIPTSSADRATMFGLMNEIQGEGGLLFNKRFALVPPEGNEFGLKYGWSPEAVATADARIVDILGVLNAQLESQKAAGSQFFIGNSLTVLDLHWAAFSNMVGKRPPIDLAARGDFNF